MKRILTTTLSAGFALLAANAFAETTSNANISIAEAVAAAESALGAKAFEAELDAGRNGLVYEVALVKEGRALKAEIDYVTGKLISQNQPNAIARLWPDSDIKAAQSAPRSLTETIAMVEKSTKGEVSEIDLDRRNGRHYYEVELVGAQDRTILVDMKTGAFTPLIDD
ncbi:MAG: PepSY domain-containing protein [Caulobacterales bacterium]